MLFTCRAEVKGEIGNAYFTQPVQIAASDDSQALVIFKQWLQRLKVEICNAFIHPTIDTELKKEQAPYKWMDTNGIKPRAATKKKALDIDALNDIASEFG